MIALSSQFEQANKLIKKYGKDNTGTIDYKFNSKGFRSYDEYIVKPDILFAGGSISFGIGVDEVLECPIGILVMLDHMIIQ